MSQPSRPGHASWYNTSAPRFETVNQPASLGARPKQARNAADIGVTHSMHVTSVTCYKAETTKTVHVQRRRHIHNWEPRGEADAPSWKTCIWAVIPAQVHILDLGASASPLSPRLCTCTNLMHADFFDFFWVFCTLVSALLLMQAHDLEGEQYNTVFPVSTRRDTYTEE